MRTPISLPFRRLARPARRVRGAALVALLAACTGDPASPPPVRDTLPAGTYVLERADGQALPAVIAHEQPAGDGYVQTFADAATLTVTADGRWRQDAALRTVRFADGAVLGRPGLGDRGRWAALPGGGGYLLASELQAWRPASRVRLRADGSLEVTERMGHELGGLVVGEYRQR